MTSNGANFAPGFKNDKAFAHLATSLPALRIAQQERRTERGGPFTPQPLRQLLGSWAPGSAGKKPGEGQSPNFFIQTNGLWESPEAAGKESLELRDWE